MTIAILGRQSALSLAELEALFGADHVQPLGSVAARINLPYEQVIQHELGGSIKIAQELSELPSTDWRSLVASTSKYLPRLIHTLPSEGKIRLGLSTYNLSLSSGEIERAGLSLKRVFRAAGRSIRLVPNPEPALSSASVLHNKLTNPTGIELVYLRHSDRTILARTVHVQDITAYAARDHGRPYRDARIGMLPPKLAQIMIHLAAGSRQPRVTPGGAAGPEEVEEAASYNSRPTLLDPFCGTGVVLQEATLMGYSPYGSDLNERMVRYSRDNLNWLNETHRMFSQGYLEAADATTHTWRPPIDLVVCESYLGTPFTTAPSPQALADSMHECNRIMRAFLTNIHAQLAAGTRLCVAAPAWFIGKTIKHLPCLDELAVLGYERVVFSHARPDELIYHREGQIVGRELLVLVRRGLTKS